jgi:hypothetical protein
MPACHIRHDRARRKRFRDDPPLVRVTPPSPATNATANLDAPSRRGSVNYMVDHICEPMPSTGSHLPNYAARCKMGERHRLPSDKARMEQTDRLSAWRLRARSPGPAPTWQPKSAPPKSRSICAGRSTIWGCDGYCRFGGCSTWSLHQLRILFSQGVAQMGTDV